MGQRHQRRARPGAADHGLGQAPALVRNPVRLPVEELPEAADILMELPEHQIAAVAPEVAPVGRVLRRWQVERAAIRARVDQGTLRVAAVLVAVAEHDLARSDHVDVFGLLLVVRVERAPVELRLAQPVGEAERLDLAHVEGVEAGLDAEPGIPIGPLTASAHASSPPSRA